MKPEQSHEPTINLATAPAKSPSQSQGLGTAARLAVAAVGDGVLCLVKGEATCTVYGCGRVRIPDVLWSKVHRLQARGCSLGWCWGYKRIMLGLYEGAMRRLRGLRKVRVLNLGLCPRFVCSHVPRVCMGSMFRSGMHWIREDCCYGRWLHRPLQGLWALHVNGVCRSHREHLFVLSWSIWTFGEVSLFFHDPCRGGESWKRALSYTLTLTVYPAPGYSHKERLEGEARSFECGGPAEPWEQMESVLWVSFLWLVLDFWGL